jgi:hypothetical protein
VAQAEVVQEYSRWFLLRESRIARWFILKPKISTYLGLFCRALEWKNVGIVYVHLVSFMSIWYHLCPFGIIYVHLVSFMSIWYHLWPCGVVCGPLVYFPVLVCLDIWQPWKGQPQSQSATPPFQNSLKKGVKNNVVYKLTRLSN